MSEKEAKKVSIARSKKTTITIIDALGPEVASSFIPGLGFLYKFGKAFFEHGYEFYQDRKKARLEDFHHSLLNGTVEEDFESFINKPFSLEDYYSLLEGAVQDQENDKVPVYARFFRAIVEQSVPEQYKIYLIKALKELTSSDLNLLREIFVSSKYHFVGKGGLHEQIKEIMETQDTMKWCSVQKLLRLGFIKPTEQKAVNAIGPYMLTDILEVFVQNTFDKTELTPEMLGQKAWKNIGIITIVVPDIIKYSKHIDLLQKTLTGLCLQSTNMRPQKGRNYTSVIYSGYLILCLDDESGRKDSDMSFFINQPKIKIKNIVKLLLSASADGTAYDPFPDVPAIAKFDFVSEKSYETQNLIEFFKEATKQ